MFDPRKKAFQQKMLKGFSVVWAGIEPATQGFSAL
jgi:hypothetical protein